MNIKTIVRNITTLVLVLVTASSEELNFTGFVNFENTPQNFTATNISPFTFSIQDIDVSYFTKNIAWTIELSGEGGPIISSMPAKVVDISVENDVLKFSFNEVSASDPERAGVRIQVPSENLKSVTVGDTQDAQILKGFTSLTDLSVSGASTLHATLTSMVEGTVVSVQASTVSNIFLETDAPTQVDIGGASTARIKGSVSGGTVGTVSKLYVDGNITGQVEVSGASDVFVNDESGCDNVALASDVVDECSVTDVNVEVKLLPTTYSGRSGGASSFHMSKKSIMSIMMGASAISSLVFV